jgi:hypothetical protein
MRNQFRSKWINKLKFIHANTETYYMGLLSGIKKNIEPPPLAQGNKSQDSASGNGTGNAYENIWRRKAKKEASTKAPDISSAVNSSSENGAEEKQAHSVPPLRIQTGWEQLLFVQRKICEKARNLMINLEAPVRYFSAKKGKLLSGRYQGVILDFETKILTDKKKEGDEEDSSDPFDKSA